MVFCSCLDFNICIVLYLYKTKKIIKHTQFVHIILNVCINCCLALFVCFCCMVCYLFVVYGHHGSAITIIGGRKSCTLPAGFHGGPGNYVRVSNT